MKGVFWTLAFIGSLVFLAAAYYVTSPGMRAFVDPKLPWVNSYLRNYVRGSADTSPEDGESAPTPAASSASASTAAPVVDNRPKRPANFDLNWLAENKAEWPAKVKILKPTTFPAVANGKVVGNVVAPAGSEVGLVQINGGKLGVQYQGGGAYLPVDETDLVSRWGK